VSSQTIQKATSVRGEITCPGDKSLSHRAVILASVAEGTSKISGLSGASDVRDTVKCIKQLGVSIRGRKNLVIEGVGSDGLKAPDKPLDAGNSGTTMRLLAGLLAAQPFTATITGDESLQKRPMRRIIDPLEMMGAYIDSHEYRAPLTIRGGPLRAIDYSSTIASAQVKSCVLIAGLFARGVTRFTEPYLSRDHTERMLFNMGATIKSSQAMVVLQGLSRLKALDIEVPGDMSAAAFFLVAASILKDSELVLKNVGQNPTRNGILEALTAMNAHYSINNEHEIHGEPRADITVHPAQLKSTTLAGAMIPRIIDEIPILAVAATQAEGTTTIKDAGELRVKESDRLSALADNLERMGADLREKEDGLVIKGPVTLKGAEIDSYGDHRIAMAFAIAGLIAEGETVIKNSDCVDVSFPTFFDLLEEVRVD